MQPVLARFWLRYLLQGQPRAIAAQHYVAAFDHLLAGVAEYRLPERGGSLKVSTVKSDFHSHVRHPRTGTAKARLAGDRHGPKSDSPSLPPSRKTNRSRSWRRWARP